MMANEDKCALFNFIVWGAVGSGLYAFGYVGNLLSVFALQRDIRTPTTTLLQSLAVSDLVLLLSVCITDAVPYICAYTGECSNPWTAWPNIRYIWMLTPVSHMCSIWLVVLVSGNRYWAVCRPHSTGVVWTNRRTWIYVGCVIVLVTAFNMPRLFEYGFEESCANDTTHNFSTTKQTLNVTESSLVHPQSVTIHGLTEYEKYSERLSEQNDYKIVVETSTSSCNKIIVEVKSDFGETHSYKVVYKVMLVNALLVLFPLAFLLVSSIWIVRTLRLSQRMSNHKKRSMAYPSSVSNQHFTTTTVNGSSCATDGATRRARIESLQRAEVGVPIAFNKRTTPSREVTFLLVTVVLVAVFCQTPLAVFHFVRYAYKYDCGDTVFYLESFSKFLVNLNSCINFVIYCLLSPRFRRMLKDALTCSMGRPRDRRGSAVPAPSRMQFEFSVRESFRRRVT